MNPAKIVVFLAVLSVYTPLKAEWRLELYAGKFFPGRSDLTVRRPAAGDDITYHKVKWSDRSFDLPFYYGLRVSKFPSRESKVGFEMEFIHAKVYSDPEAHVRAAGRLANQPVAGTRRLGDHIQQFDISHGLNFFLANLVWRTAWWRDESFSSRNPFVVFRSGVGACVCHTESTIDWQHREQYEWRGPGFQTSIGGVLPLNRAVSLMLEYKFSHVWLRGLKVHKGDADSGISGSHLVFGSAVTM